MLSASVRGLGSQLHAIDFCALWNVRPMIETVTLADVPAAFARMKKGEARFRFVMTVEP